MKVDGWLARRTFLWRDYWARRSRLRAATTSIILIVAVFVGALALTPTTWLAVARGRLAAFGSTVSALDPHLIEVVGLVALLALATTLALLPPTPRRYRRNAMFAGQAPSKPSAAARTLVYLDAENQPASDFKNTTQRTNTEKTLELLVNRVRAHLDGRRADLLFYMDSTIRGYADRRRELYRYGFRLVDVPHDPFHTGGDKPGMVDMELALQAHGRSLAAAQPQNIILIAADQDYIPLVYQLWSEGHAVEVWGDFLPESFRKLNAYLPVKVVEYDPQSPGANLAVAAAVDAAAQLDGAALARLTAWIGETINALKAVNADATINANLKSDALGKQLGKTLKWLRQGEVNLTPYWLFHLQTTGALIRRDQGVIGGVGAANAGGRASNQAPTDIQMYVVGPVEASLAAERSGRLLMRVAAIAQAMRMQDVKPDVTLERLCELTLRRPLEMALRHDLQRMPQRTPLDDVFELARVLSPQNTIQFTYAQLYCVCARELGLLTFDQQALFAEKRLLLAPPATE